MKPPLYLKPGDEMRLGIEGLGEQQPEGARVEPRADRRVTAMDQLVDQPGHPHPPGRRRRHRAPPAASAARAIASEGITVARPGPARATRSPCARSRAGAPVRRYNQIIGIAKQADRAGPARAHAQPRVRRASRATTRSAQRRAADRLRRRRRPPSTGIVRADGRIATRNYIGILTSVNCSATVGARDRRPLPARHPTRGARARIPNVDGVVALTHGAGCATDSDGEPLQVLRRTLGGYARHPNFAAVLVVGLGCETNQIAGLLEQEGLADRRATLHTFNIQDTGGTRKTVAHGIELVEWLLEEANRVERAAGAGAATSPSACSAAAPTATRASAPIPALGAAVDLLVRHGGTAILSETPEIYGGEHLLTRRAVSQRGRPTSCSRGIRWWERYTRAQRRRDGQQPVGRQQGRRPDDHPREVARRDRQGRHDQPGRRLRVRRSRSRRKGLVFMDTPGYDPVSATGQVAGGANLICFTTGRGSAYGCAPSPSLKLATNTALWQQAGRRHRHQLRRHRRRHRQRSTRWASASSR